MQLGRIVTRKPTRKGITKLLGGILVAVAALLLIPTIILLLFSIPVPDNMQRNLIQRLLAASHIDSVSITGLTASIDHRSFELVVGVDEAVVIAGNNVIQLQVKNGEASIPWDTVFNQTFYPKAVRIAEVDVSVQQQDGREANSNSQHLFEEVIGDILSLGMPTTLKELHFDRVSLQTASSTPVASLVSSSLSMTLASDGVIEGIWTSLSNGATKSATFPFLVMLNEQEEKIQLSVSGTAKDLLGLIGLNTSTGNHWASLANGAFDATAYLYPNGFDGTLRMLGNQFAQATEQVITETNEVQFDFAYSPSVNHLVIDNLLVNTPLVEMQSNGVIQFQFEERTKQLRLDGNFVLVNPFEEEPGMGTGFGDDSDIGFTVTLPRKGKMGDYGAYIRLSDAKYVISAGRLSNQNRPRFDTIFGYMGGRIGPGGNLESMAGQIVISEESKTGRGRLTDMSNTTFDFSYDFADNSLGIKDFIYPLGNGHSQILAEMKIQGSVLSSMPQFTAHIDLWISEGHASAVRPAKAGIGHFTLDLDSTSTITVSFELGPEKRLLRRLGLADWPVSIADSSGHISLLLNENFAPQAITGTVKLPHPRGRKGGETFGSDTMSISVQGKFEGNDLVLEKGTVDIFPYSFDARGTLSNYSGLMANDFAGSLQLQTVDHAATLGSSLQSRINDFVLHADYADSTLSLDAQSSNGFLMQIMELDLGQNPMTSATDQLNGTLGVHLKMDLNSSMVWGNFEGEALQLPLRGLESGLFMRSLKAEFMHNFRSGELDLAHVALQSNYLGLKAEGKLFTDETGFANEVVGNLNILDLNSSAPGVLEVPLDDVTGSVDFGYRFTTGELTLGQVYLAKENLKVLAKGTLRFADDGPHGSIDYTVRNLTDKYFLRLWPRTMFEKPRLWLEANAHHVDINEAHGGIVWAGEARMKLHLAFTFSELEFSYLSGFPNIKNAEGYGTITNSNLSIALENGEISVSDVGVLDIAGSRLFIPDNSDNRVPADIHLNFSGPIQPLFVLLNHDPFNFLARANIPTDFMDGTVEGQLDLSLPFVKRVTYDMITVNGRGHFLDVTSKVVAFERNLQAPQLDVRVDDQGIEISGGASFGDVPISMNWQKKFDSEGQDVSTAQGEFQLSDSVLRELGIPYLPNIVSGSSLANYRITLNSVQPAQLELFSSLKGVALDIPFVGRSKPSDQDGNLQLKIELNDGIEIPYIEYSTKGLRFAGTAALGDDNQLKSLSLDSLAIEDTYTGTLGFSIFPDGIYQVELGGVLSGLDMKHFSQLTDDGASKPRVVLIIDEIQVTEGLYITDFEGELNPSDKSSASFSALVNGGAKINGLVRRIDERWQATITSRDIGRLIKDIGLAPEASGGSMELEFRTLAGSGRFEGTLEVENLAIAMASTIESAIRETDQGGEPLEGRIYEFESIRAEFSVEGRTVDLKRATGTLRGTGISAAGNYDLDSREIAISGAVAPLRQLNIFFNIIFPHNWLLPGPAKTVFSWEYEVSGVIDNPRVSVNPLPKLTPAVLGTFFFPSVIPVL